MFSLHCLTINFNGFLEYFNVSIKVNVFDIDWVLQLLACQLSCWVGIGCVVGVGYHGGMNMHGSGASNPNDQTCGLNGGLLGGSIMGELLPSESLSCPPSNV
jgi:hypothetical protein